LAFSAISVQIVVGHRQYGSHHDIEGTRMAKRKNAKSNVPAPKTDGDSNRRVFKQTAGAVTGAVVGGVVGGPAGALAGGAVGAIVGDSSAKGKKPIRRAVDAIRENVTGEKAKEALKSLGARIKSLRKTKTTKKAAAKKSADKVTAVTKTKKAKPTPRKSKSSKAAKGAAAPPKKKAKRKT
jgi:hypothetical protein